MKRLAFILILIFLVMSGACATDSPWSVSEDTVIFKGVADTSRPSPDNKVYLTEEPLRERTGYKELGEIKVLTPFYGGSEKIYQMIANKGLEVGADAVVEVQVWHQPTGGAWAAPQGSGTAIKLDDNSKVDLTKYKGKWWKARIVKEEPKKNEDVDQQMDG